MLSNSLSHRFSGHLFGTDAGDSEWKWHQLGHMQVCTSLQTDNHASTPPLSFFTGRMLFLPPNQQRQSTEGKIKVYAMYIVWNLLQLISGQLAVSWEKWFVAASCSQEPTVSFVVTFSNDFTAARFLRAVKLCLFFFVLPCPFFTTYLTLHSCSAFNIQPIRKISVQTVMQMTGAWFLQTVGVKYDRMTIFWFQ